MVAGAPRPRIVITGRVPGEAVTMLGAEHDVVSWDGEELMDRAELLARVAGADAVLSLLTEKIDAELLDAAGPQLRVVANVAVGYNNIDVAACHARGITVTNTPGVLTDATADIAMALILMSTRRLAEGERVIRRQDPWRWGMFYMLGTGIQGRQLGIVGMGQIGAALARRAKAFGMTIAYSNRNPVADDLAAELGCVRMEMAELLATSDVVSLHCPYSPATHHLIGAAELTSMRDNAFLINTARGPVVDEAALAAALAAGEIAGAGLDVFEDEPTVHPGLLDLDNVVLIPHLGSATIETRTAMATLAATNALAVLRGDAAVTPISG
ncbi:MAG: glyoxylate reductase [Ilumatobacteraceae bacterium]|nr:glyoxylate reductase [Ilumatobacteraceae bacterium]